MPILPLRGVLLPRDWQAAPVLADLLGTGETLDLGDLPNGWRLIDPLWARVGDLEERADDPELTARKIDEASPSGHGLYIGASRHLQVAMDTHRALLALLEHHGATPFAPWNLLRPVREASFYALWALEPATSAERRQRAVRLEVADYLERQKWLSEYGKAPRIGRAVREQVAQREASTGKTYRNEATKVGLSWSRAQAKVNLVDELPKLGLVAGRGSPVPGYLLVGTWRSLSGFQHGYGYPVLHNSDLTEEVPVPGGATVHAVINDGVFTTTAYVAALMFWKACELYVRRCRRPD